MFYRILFIICLILVTTHCSTVTKQENANNTFAALFGGMDDKQRLEKYFFEEQNGQIVMEAEHFATQLYGSDSYDGKRWWMVNTEDNQASDLPVFSQACDLARQELLDIKNTFEHVGDRKEYRPKFAAHWDSPKGTGKLGDKGLNADEIFAVFKCDPDPSHAENASGKRYIELLPDMLYSNFDAIPHPLAHWPNGAQSPKIFWRLYSSGGEYHVYLRLLRGHNQAGTASGLEVNAPDTDSGDVHIGTAAVPNKHVLPAIKRIGPSADRDGLWTWVQATEKITLPQGEHFFFIAGREDGSEVDKIVLSKTTCKQCSEEGPVESPTRLTKTKSRRY